MASWSWEQKPENKEKKSVSTLLPTTKEKRRLEHQRYDQRPEVKEKEKRYWKTYHRLSYQRSENKEKRRLYNQQPEVKERK